MNASQVSDKKRLVGCDKRVTNRLHEVENGGKLMLEVAWLRC